VLKRSGNSVLLAFFKTVFYTKQVKGVEMIERLRLSDPNDNFVSSHDLRCSKNELAAYYSQRYADTDEVIVINIRKGAGAFTWDLIRAIEHPNLIYKEIKTRTMNGTVGGEVIIEEDLDIDIEDKHLLVADDMLDRVSTMHRVISTYRGRNPASLEVAAMMEKIGARAAGTDLHVPVMSGIKIARVYVVGNGLDYNEKYRHFPFVTKFVETGPNQGYPVVSEEPAEDPFSSYPFAA
jgi:hypoxanthine phosphoribosyltransferase